MALSGCDQSQVRVGKEPGITGGGTRRTRPPHAAFLMENIFELISQQMILTKLQIPKLINY